MASGNETPGLVPATERAVKMSARQREILLAALERDGVRVPKYGSGRRPYSALVEADLAYLERGVGQVGKPEYLHLTDAGLEAARTLDGER